MDSQGSLPCQELHLAIVSLQCCCRHLDLDLLSGPPQLPYQAVETSVVRTDLSTLDYQGQADHRELARGLSKRDMIRRDHSWRKSVPQYLCLSPFTLLGPELKSFRKAFPLPRSVPTVPRGGSPKLDPPCHPRRVGSPAYHTWGEGGLV